jgi:hypothetical protein
MKEPSEATTGITGYFTNVNLSTISHATNGADVWHPVNGDNLVVDNVFDHASSYGWPIGQAGTYTWPIHPIWAVDTNGTAKPLSGWTDQIMTLSADGTMRVDKLGHYVTRQINEYSGTAH